MKIAATSNFDHDYFTEYFVAHDVSEHWAKLALKHLNGDRHTIYYRIVPNDYKLRVFTP